MEKVSIVISWTNAEKRLYGSHHWFWAVWHVTGVPEDTWNNTEPLESGFCRTKSEVLAKTFLNRGQVLQRNQWCQQYLDFKRDQEQRPFFSRIRTGRKWFWCAGSDLVDDPEFTGFATSAEAALADAIKAAGKQVQQSGNWMARIALRHLRAEKIRQRRDHPHQHRPRLHTRPISECFQVLGIDATSGVTDVKKAYRRLALIHHPDLGGDPVEFIRIHNYYEQALARLQK